MAHHHPRRAEVRLGTPPTVQGGCACAGRRTQGRRVQSAETYLALWKVTEERRGFPLTVDIHRLLKDVIRSCKRGRGAPMKALALPLESLGKLPEGNDPWVRGGPVGPKTAIVLGSWFLARESELSTTRASFVTFGNDVRLGGETVTWHLPASKSDPEAKGVARTHGCCCGAQDWACPAHSPASR